MELSLRGRARWWAIGLAFAAMLIGASPAVAGNDERAKELYLAAEDDYAAGRYKEAADKFAKAYDLSKRPALLFNLGNTYERMGDYKRAADFLQRYLDSPNPQRVSETRQRVQNLRQRAAEQREKEEEIERLRDRPETGEEGPSRLPSYLLIGGGSAAVVAGVVLALGASSAGTEAEKNCVQGFCTTDARGDLDRERNLSIAADISFLVGAGAITAGVILLLTGDDDEGSSGEFDDEFALAPMWTRDGAGLGLTGHF